MSYSNDYSQKTRIHDMEIIIKQLYRHKKMDDLRSKSPRAADEKGDQLRSTKLAGHMHDRTQEIMHNEAESRSDYGKR